MRTKITIGIQQRNGSFIFRYAFHFLPHIVLMLRCTHAMPRRIGDKLNEKFPSTAMTTTAGRQGKYGGYVGAISITTSTTVCI